MIGPRAQYPLDVFDLRWRFRFLERRVTQRELRETFTDGWQVDSIGAAHLDTKIEDAQHVKAWLAVMTRL